MRGRARAGVRGGARAALALVVVAMAPPLLAQPSSSRNCALCHFSWMPAFLEEGRNGDLAPLPASNVVNAREMCFSCHDGSVVDSRRLVFLEHGHSTGVQPPPDMRIPNTLPLDTEGRIFCGTCHTAHGTDMGRTEMANAVFLRVENTESQLCVMCHAGMDQDFAARNHSVNVALSGAWPEALARSPALRGGAGDLICQTCHAAHGSGREDLLVLPTENSALCAACHPGEAEPGDPAAPRNHPIAVNCTACHSVHAGASDKGLLFRDNSDDGLCLFCHSDMTDVHASLHAFAQTAPDLPNVLGSTPRQAGSCSGCHTPHGAQGPMLWARAVPDGAQGQAPLCLSCHSAASGLDAPQIGAFSHPTDLRPSEGMEVAGLRLFDAGLHADPDGNLVCSSCHDAHRTELRIAAEGDALCRSCHRAQWEEIAGGHHDLTRVTSAESSRNVVAGNHGASQGPCAACHTIHHGQGPLMWARAPAAGPETAAERLCRSCHGAAEWAGASSPDAHLHPVSLANPGAHGSLPLYDLERVRPTEAGGAMTCLTCHSAHALPRDPEASTRLAASGQAPLCTECHAEQASVSAGPHDMTRAADTALADGGLCGTCHRFLDDPPTGKRYRLVSSSPTSAAGQPDAVADLCQSCHRPGGVAEDLVTPANSHPRAVAPPAALRPAHLPLFDAAGRRSADGMLTCATCHDPHRSPGGEGSPGLFLRPATEGDPALCVDCHRDQRWIEGTDHDLRVSAPEARNAAGQTAAEATLCAACHLAHPPQGHPLLWGHELGAGGDFVARACTGCHRDGGVATPVNAQALQHPPGAVVLETPPGVPNYDAQGLTGGTGLVTCATCHDPHQWIGGVAAAGAGAGAEGDALSSFTREDVAAGVCASCHGREGLVRYLLYHRGQRWGRPALVPWRGEE